MSTVYREAFTVTRAWCGPRIPDPTPYLERVAFVLLTESGGRNLANDGAAFADDAETTRPGWVTDPGTGWVMPAGQRAALRAVLRLSLDLPHDAVGSNGGSTGPFQQLSQAFVAVRFPGRSWGYGTIRDTMHTPTATVAFLERLRVTADPEYQRARFPDALVADVLRVQQPRVDEHESDNYSAGRVDEARRILAEHDTRPTITTGGVPPMTESHREWIEDGMKPLPGLTRDAVWHDVQEGEAPNLPATPLAMMRATLQLAREAVRALARVERLQENEASGKVLGLFHIGGGVARVDYGSGRWRPYGSPDQMTADTGALLAAGWSVLHLGAVDDPAARGWVREDTEGTMGQ